MGAPGYCYSNRAYTAYVANAGNITPSTEDSTYTKASLVDYRIDKPFRFTTTSGTILIDLDSALACDFLWIGQHNFAAGVTLALTAGNTSACSDFTASPAPAYALTNIFLRFTEQTYRYWKLSVTSSGANAEMCELFLGVFAQFSANFAHGWQKGRSFTNDFHATEFGSINAYERYQIRTRRFNWVNQTATLESEIETLFQATSGNYRPFVLVPDVATNFSLFGRVVGDYQAQNVPAGDTLYTLGIDFREESPGKTLA